MAYKIADGYVEVHGRVDEGSFKRAAKDAVDGFSTSGDRAGDAFVKAFSKAAGRAGGGGGGRRSGLWNQIRQMFTPNPGMMKTLMHPLESSLSVPIVAAIAAGIVGHGATAIAAAIQSAVLLGVGGVVVAGAAALLSDKLNHAFKHAMGRIQKTLQDAAKPLVGPFKTALDDIAGIVEDLAPQFERMFRGAAPIIPLLVDSFAAFAETILPAIADIMPSVVKMFGVLAARSPEIADAVADLFTQMAQPETIEAFGYILTGLIGIIRGGTAVLGAFTRSFNRGTKEISKFGKLASAAAGLVAGAVRRIPTRWITKYLFSPGAALAWIGRVTGATKHIPRLWRTVYRFLGSIGPIRSVINWIARIPRNVSTTFTSVTRNITESITRFANPFARASGGIIGAQGMATGGISGSRSVLVGEQGPEMVNLPFGSRVTPAGQTRAQLGQGGQGGRVVIEVHSGGSRLDDVLVELLRKSIRARAGGRPNSVQVVLGN